VSPPRRGLARRAVRSLAFRPAAKEKIVLAIRVTTATVTFSRAFALDEIDHEIPAGSYTVETEEETLDNVSFIAYRRVATRIYVPSGRDVSNAVQMWEIHPNGLAFALSQDRARAR
jgi:hypothetical protein